MLVECSNCGAPMIITSSIKYTLELAYEYLCGECEKHQEPKEETENADI